MEQGESTLVSTESDTDAAAPMSCATETPWPAARAVAPWIANQPAPSSLFDLLNGPLFCVEIPFTMVDGGIVPSFDDMAQEKVSYPLPAGQVLYRYDLGQNGGYDAFGRWQGNNMCLWLVYARLPGQGLREMIQIQHVAQGHKRVCGRLASQFAQELDDNANSAARNFAAFGVAGDTECIGALVDKRGRDVLVYHSPCSKLW